MLRIFAIIGYAALVLWVILSLIVVIFLFDSWSHPGTKSISNKDLVDYFYFSFGLLIVFIFSKLLERRFNA